jgi:hypothetical protein
MPQENYLQFALSATFYVLILVIFIRLYRERNQRVPWTRNSNEVEGNHNTSTVTYNNGCDPAAIVRQLDYLHATIADQRASITILYTTISQQNASLESNIRFLEVMHEENTRLKRELATFKNQKITPCHEKISAFASYHRPAADPGANPQL